MSEPPQRPDLVSGQVVDAAFMVHRALGPGLLETVYEQCLAYELQSRGLTIRQQVVVPVHYREIRIDGGFRMDMLVADHVIVEVKAVEKLLPVHEAQLLTYLKLFKKPVGLLLNFNVPLIKQGIKRMVITI
jgi:GxxExxY protein